MAVEAQRTLGSADLAQRGRSVIATVPSTWRPSQQPLAEEHRAVQRLLRSLVTVAGFAALVLTLALNG